MLTVKTLIEQLQKLDPEMQVLVEASDGDLPYAASSAEQTVWLDMDDGTETPIALIGFRH